MKRRKIIGVIGNASISPNSKKWQFAFEVGKLLVDHGYRVANGGMGGVMQASIEGAKSSDAYQEGMTLTLVPSYGRSSGIADADIIIPTGMGLARNILLTSMADAIIAIGGGSGTLSEMAFSWQMGKLIIGLDVEGWSQKLQGEQLDHRRDDEIFQAKNPKEAIDLLDELIDSYKKEYKGVGKPSLKRSKAELLLNSNFGDLDYEYLGKGKEGFIFSTENRIFKVFKKKNPLSLFWKLSALSEDIKLYNTKYLVNFQVNLYEDHMILWYNRFEVSSYDGGYEKDLIQIAKELKGIGWLYTDIQPKNMAINISKDTPVILDIGHSFEPYSSNLFTKMLRRMYISILLGGEGDRIKPVLTETNSSEQFSLATDYGLNPREVQTNFEKFKNKILTMDKKEILNPLLREIVSELDIETVLDYGSGYGDIAKDMKEMGLDVAAYEPDTTIYKKYREKYYQEIEFIPDDKLEKALNSPETFDCVILSLVLCHPLDEDESRRLEIIDQIMKNITRLSNQYLIIVICNPLYSMKEESNLQKREWNGTFNYFEEQKLTKLVHSSNNTRSDYHRPMSFYEKLFQEFDLKIVRIEQTGRVGGHSHQVNSDFMIFLLEM